MVEFEISYHRNFFCIFGEFWCFSEIPEACFDFLEIMEDPYGILKNHFLILKY